MGELYYTLINISTKNDPKFSFDIFGKTYVVDTNVFNRIFRFSFDNCEPLPDKNELLNFFYNIGYKIQPLNLIKLCKNHLTKEWTFLFDTLSKVFSAKTGGFHAITHII